MEIAGIIKGVAALAVLASLVGLYVMAKKSGRNAQRAEDLARAEGIREKQLEEANKPRDPANVVDILRRGEF